MVIFGRSSATSTGGLNGWSVVAGRAGRAGGGGGPRFGLVPQGGLRPIER